MQAAPNKTYRWADNQLAFLKYFVVSRDAPWVWSVVLDSGADDYSGCTLRLRGFGWTLIVFLPPVIKPWRRWVKYKSAGFWDEHPNEFGFSVSDGFLRVFFGAQTGDSQTTENWCAFLPWTQWRFVRYSLYGRQGEHFWTQMEDEARARLGAGGSFTEQHGKSEAVPKRVFMFTDFDGEEITAKTHIEERQWAFGTGWFRWLSWFRRDKVCRSLDIRFSSETGKRKGSWKGGTIGHSIDMLPGELHESAFRRYCREHNMRFIGDKVGVYQ